MNNQMSVNLSNPQDAIKFLNNALNKSCKAGVFTLDEAYLIKLAINTLEHSFADKLIDKDVENKN